MRIPVANFRPALDNTETEWRANLEALFAKGQFILGPQVKAFEQEFAAGMGAQFAVGVGNGTNAIELALRDAEVTGEVLTTALTSPFTATAIRAAGCTPRFADIDPLGLQIDVDDLKRRLTDRIQAVVAVHLYGQPCDLSSIAEAIRVRDIVLVQDACQAHRAMSSQRPLTAWSDYACYSFYPTKNLGALGDGGAITTDSAAAAQRLRRRRDGGRGEVPQVSDVAGSNSRLDEMQCCFLRAFLPHLADWNKDRRRLARLYDQALQECPGVRIVQRDSESVCHLYVVRADRRDELRSYLEQHGIGTGVHYPVPLHLHPAFADCGLKRGDLPIAERACNEIVSLPLWPYMLDDDVLEVAERIHKFY